MLKLENITFTVRAGGEEKTILRDVSLELGAGKLAVITGPNGGGKSTLARIIAGIEKPTSGRIFFDGAASPSAPGSASASRSSSRCGSRAFMSSTFCGSRPGGSSPCRKRANTSPRWGSAPATT